MTTPETQPASGAGSVTPSGAPRVRAEVDGRLGPDVVKTLKRRLWVDRFTSAWSPVTLFGLLFLVYLFVVELHTPSEAWARPVLKGFGVLALLALVGLWVAPFVLRKVFHLRRLRSHARELEEEFEELADKGRGVTAATRAGIVERTVALDQAMASGETAPLEAEVQAFTEHAEKNLKGLRRNSSMFFASGLFKAFLVALLIRGVLIEPFKIPSGSMIPTLAIGDQIFVNKFIYGVRLPFMNVVPFKIVREPRRGDVIVFNNPTDESKDFIKRVVGIPGDRISIRGELVILNGVPQKRTLLADPYYFDHRDETGPWERVRATLYDEYLDDRPHAILQTPGVTVGDEFPEFVVPPKSVFVMGDNRENSSDSRLAFGSYPPVLKFVPYGNIKGKAMVIWLSWSKDGFLSSYFDGSGIRTDRFFLPVR